MQPNRVQQKRDFALCRDIAKLDVAFDSVEENARRLFDQGYALTKGIMRYLVYVPPIDTDGSTLWRIKLQHQICDCGFSHPRFAGNGVAFSGDESNAKIIQDVWRAWPVPEADM